jgi:hypothetical protein
MFACLFLPVCNEVDGMEKPYYIPSNNIAFPNHEELASLEKESLRPGTPGNLTVSNPDESGFVSNISLHENDIINSVKLPLHEGVQKFQVHYMSRTNPGTWELLRTEVNKVRNPIKFLPRVRSYRSFLGRGTIMPNSLRIQTNNT